MAVIDSSGLGDGQPLLWELAKDIATELDSLDGDACELCIEALQSLQRQGGVLRCRTVANSALKAIKHNQAAPHFSEWILKLLGTSCREMLIQALG